MSLLLTLFPGAVLFEQDEAMWDIIKCAIYKSRYEDAPLVPHAVYLSAIRTQIQDDLWDNAYYLNSQFFGSAFDTITEKGYQLMAMSAIEDDPDPTCAILCEEEPPPPPLEMCVYEAGYNPGLIDEGEGWFTAYDVVPEGDGVTAGIRRCDDGCFEADEFDFTACQGTATWALQRCIDEGWEYYDSETFYQFHARLTTGCFKTVVQMCTAGYTAFRIHITQGCTE